MNKNRHDKQTKKMKKRENKKMTHIHECNDPSQSVSIRFRYMKVLGYRVLGIDIDPASLCSCALTVRSTKTRTSCGRILEEAILSVQKLRQAWTFKRLPFAYPADFLGRKRTVDSWDIQLHENIGPIKSLGGVRVCPWGSRSIGLG